MSELFVAGIVPEFASKNPAWFKKNRRNIEHGRIQHAFWERNSLLITPSWNLGLTRLAERLTELGYEMSVWPEHKGEFTVRGGAIVLFPINEAGLWHIDFFGKTIERISELAENQNVAKEATFARKRRLYEYLQNGDYVVHEYHGVGIWRGTKKEHERVYFSVEYRGPKTGSPDMLMVPIEEEKRLTPYIGFRVPQVTRLGTPLWQKIVKKTKEEALVFARKLLELYAHRELANRTPYKHTPDFERAVEETFPYEETPSQKRALTDIGNDLSQHTPMDRILIGDVGFGKTEIALRASARVAGNGKQVALLAPTTLLSDQHFATWQKRFKDLPLRIVRLSRLETGTEERRALTDIATGKADIIVGTHRILSSDVHWHNLGLLIIDEEQRFGVRAKEQIKNIKKEVDVLTLSATPLPRTLSLALAHIKNMSALEEPPHGRLPIQTIASPYKKEILKRAIKHELKRKGQLYVLESRIRSIPETLETLSTIVSKKRIGYIHGRLSEEALVETMRRFREREIDILISTTIIENGIDLSDVNTLIVSDATRFGLSQMHQLRGRVGRGTEEAFAYFLYNPKKLGDKARERLDILASMQFLGAGQMIAEKDMEMRGAGNILGKEQSGVARAVGLNLYSQFLAEAVERLRGKT